MSKKSLRYLVGIIALIFLLQLSCNLPSIAIQPTQDSQAVFTQAAQTFIAQLTMGATPATPLPTLSEKTPEGFPPTNTALPIIILPSSTPIPTNTLPPTVTQIPPATLTQPPTATAVPCLSAQFVKDVTIPDGTTFKPNESFTKVWRLRNTGSCAWGTNFSVVFESGARMSGVSTHLPKVTNPGDTVDADVDLVAPSGAGTYKGNWLLSDPNGNEFGLGTKANKPFWVQINVEVKTPEKGIVYNFATSYCSADWESGAGELACPGREGNASGFVILLDEPSLETRNENEPTIWTNPQMVKDGYIKGTYPAFKIKSGDHFLADVGCLADSPKCDVVFVLRYRIGDGSIKKLGDWQEVYDHKITRIDIDLSDLDGKNVTFILEVQANGSASEDAAFWLMPQIYRP